jgi:hypothetical protein
LWKLREFCGKYEARRELQYGRKYFPWRFGPTVIVLNILCDSGHRFEGWFASTDAFRSQCERQLVNCPHCQTSEVRLLPSAPHVRRSAAAVPSNPCREPRPARPIGRRLPANFSRSLAQAAKLAENVGERFPEEARRIHYDEAPCAQHSWPCECRGNRGPA